MRAATSAILAVLVAGAASARAQDGPVPAGEESIVVTGTRLAQDEGVVPARVTVLDRARIERSAATTLDDLLREVPGFSPFRRTSSLVAHPTAQGVSLRGLGGTAASRTLVLLDGIPLDDPFGSWLAWNRIPLAAIERIEIVPASVATAWGSLALGGVVHVVTRCGPANVALEAGERGTAVVDGQAALERDRWSACASVRALTTDGWHLLPPSQRGAIDEAAATESLAAMATVRRTLGRDWRVQVRARAFGESRDNGTPYQDNATRLATLDATADGPLPGALGSLRLDAVVDDAAFESRFSGVAPDRASETPALDQHEVPADALGLAVTWTSRELARGGASAGVDWRASAGETRERFRFVDGAFTRSRRAGGRHELAGLHAQGAWRPREDLEVSGGLRVDSWRASAGHRRERDASSGSLLRDETFRARDRTLLSPRLGLLHQATPKWSERLAIARGFRAPTLNELYRPFRVRNDVTEADPALDPETSLTVEAGVERSGPRWSAHATIAQATLDDAIANVTIGDGPGTIDPCGFVPEGGTCRQRTNVGRARVRSAEAGFGLRATPRTRVRLDALLVDARFTRTPGAPGLRGRRLPQVPRVQATLALDLDLRRAGALAVTARHVGDAFEDDQNVLELGDAMVVDLAWRRALRGGWDVGVRASNLLGERVEAGLTEDGLLTLGAPRLVTARLAWRGGSGDSGRMAP